MAYNIHFWDVEDLCGVCGRILKAWEELDQPEAHEFSNDFN